VNKIKTLATRRDDDEQGFTLIELMVVVLIIAILIAIAIPTFLGARARAQDRAAQSDLRNGLTAEKTVYTDNQSYDATTATMVGIESSLNWNDTKASGKSVLTVTTGTAVSTDDIVCLTETSQSGKVFAIIDVAAGTSAGTYFGTAAPATCDVAATAGMKSAW
jgi:type IV pilus assembly protein PilA